MDPIPHRSFPLPHPLPHPVPHYLVMCHFNRSVLDYQWTILDRLPVMHLIALPDIRLSSLRLSVKVEHTLCHSLSGHKTQSRLLSSVHVYITSASSASSPVPPSSLGPFAQSSPAVQSESDRLTVCASVRQSVRASVRPCVRPSMRLSVCPSVRLSVRQ